MGAARGDPTKGGIVLSGEVRKRGRTFQTSLKNSRSKAGARESENKAGKKLGVKASLRGNDVIGITAKDTKILLSLSLIKQREKSNSTVRDVSKRLGSKSPNAYAQYERGRLSVTLEKYEQLLLAVNPFQHRHIRLGIV